MCYIFYLSVFIFYPNFILSRGLLMNKRKFSFNPSLDGISLTL